MALAAVAPVLGIGGFALGAAATAISVLYGIVTDFNDFIDKHIQEMQSSANPTIASTGRVLEAAKFGFGLSYLSSVTIIAVGQLLLGNTLAAVTTVATAATLTNPIAMTCAAVGAILFGWNALTDSERNSILDRLAAGLQLGVELIKAVINFVIRTSQELFDSKALKEFKAHIAEKAALFGRTLSDVTRLGIDTLNDAAQAAKRQAEQAISGTAKLASEASGKISQSLEGARRAAGEVVDQTGQAARRVLKSSKKDVERSGKGPDPEAED